MQSHVYGYKDLTLKEKDFMLIETPGTIKSSSQSFGDEWQGESEEASNHKLTPGCITPIRAWAGQWCVPQQAISDDPWMNHHRKK